MSDLFAPLREPTPLSPPPPEEVRRRGDRLRRRRTGLVVTGAACLAAILVGGTSMVLGTGVRSESAPADAESVETLLGKLDLSDGMPRGEGGFPSDPELVICGEAISLGDGALASKGISWSGRGDIRTRGLSVYPDVESARTAAADLVAEAESCPRFTDGQGRVWVSNVRPTSHGDQGWVVELLGRGAGSRIDIPEVVQMVRVEENLLVIHDREIHGLSMAQLSRWTGDQVEWFLHRQMCLLAAEGCAWRSDPDVLRPDGWGELRLGMSREEIETAGDAGFSDFGECTSVDLGAGGGVLSGSDELVSMEVPAGVTTPDGVGVGSSRDEVSERYPFAVKRGEVLVIRASSTTDYMVALERGQVTELALAAVDNPCDD